LEFKHLERNCKWIFDPYFFYNRLKGKIYLSFLQNKLPELLEKVDLAIRQKNVMVAGWCAIPFSSYCDDTLITFFLNDG